MDTEEDDIVHEGSGPATAQVADITTVNDCPITAGCGPLEHAAQQVGAGAVWLPWGDGATTSRARACPGALVYDFGGSKGLLEVLELGALYAMAGWGGSCITGAALAHAAAAAHSPALRPAC